MAINHELHPVEADGGLDASLNVVGEDATPKGPIVSTTQYICMYTNTIMDGNTVADLAWTFNGIFDTSAAAFGSVITLVNVTGIKIIECEMPRAYVPVVG